MPSIGASTSSVARRYRYGEISLHRLIIAVLSYTRYSTVMSYGTSVSQACAHAARPVGSTRAGCWKPEELFLPSIPCPFRRPAPRTLVPRRYDASFQGLMHFTRTNRMTKTRRRKQPTTTRFGSAYLNEDAFFGGVVCSSFRLPPAVCFAERYSSRTVLDRHPVP